MTAFRPVQAVDAGPILGQRRWTVEYPMTIADALDRQAPPWPTCSWISSRPRRSPRCTRYRRTRRRRPNEQWYEHRFTLLRAVPYASLTAQTSRQFHWLVMVDAAMPATVRQRLDDLLADHPNFHVVPLDPTAGRRMTLGTLDWLWEAAWTTSSARA